MAPIRRSSTSAATAGPGAAISGGARPLRGREQRVLDAVASLPEESRTPSAAVAELLRQGLDLPPSTIAQILLRLERKGVLQLGRKRSGDAA